MEKISIIIPVYNVEKYIEECVESVICQTYKEIEIILVDDGSTDRCPEICDSYGGRDSRVQVIHKGNGGLSDARNAGLDIAQGEYIVFVDSDDYIAPDMIEKLYKKAKDKDADMVLCRFACIDEKGKELRRASKPIEEPIWPEDRFWNCYYNGDTVFCVVAWNKIYKRDLFRNVRYDVGRYHEDEFMLNRLVEKCRFVDMLEDTLYFYRQRTGSIMNRRDVVRHMDRTEAWLIRCQKAVDAKDYRLAEQTLLLVFEEMLFVYGQMDFQNAHSRKRYYALKKIFKKEYFAFYFFRCRGKAAVKMLLYIFSEKCYVRLRNLNISGRQK